VSATEESRPRLLGRPAWAWLALLVLLSIAVRYALGRRIVAPWIMVDELIYSELAKSFAAGQGFAIRGEAFGGAYGVVYPVLLAPAWAAFESIPSAYAAAKAINAVAISLALVPAYLLARRVVSPAGALAVAALTAVLPSMLYAGTLMTENAFFPLFLLATLALVAALERPTWARGLLLLGAVGVAFATRAQAVVFVPALLLAPLVLAAVERRSPVRWWRLYAVAGAAGAVVLLAQLGRGRSALGLLGAYRGAREQPYDPVEVLRWLLWHVAELDLALGILPFAALLLLLGIAPRLGGRERAFLVGSAVLTALLLVQVAAFASRYSLRVQERNLFYVMPLFLATLVLWVERGLPRPRLPAALAVGLAAGLPAFVPFARLIGVSAVSDTFGLLAWWDVHLWGIPLDRLWLAALAAGLLGALLLLLVPPRLAWALPAVSLAFLAVSAQPVEERIRKASVGALFQGITTQRDWIDATLGPDADVAALYSGGSLDWLTVGENEFFNRAVGDVYYLREPLPSGLRQRPVGPDSRTGALGIDARYVLVDDSVPVVGEEVARDETKRMRVIAAVQPVHVQYLVTGVYEDGWSAERWGYRGYDCAGGGLELELSQDLNLFGVPQRVTAQAGPRRVSFLVDLERTVRVPLYVEDGACSVRFSVSPSAVPGGGDTRRLGIRVDGFRRVR
jgi:hypothetical protein